MRKLCPGPRTTAFSAVCGDVFKAQKIVNRLARNQPRNPDVVELVCAMREALVDLAVLRTLVNVGHPIKRRNSVQRLVHKGKRDWAKIKRAQRLRYAQQAAARMRIDPNELPALLVA